MTAPREMKGRREWYSVRAMTVGRVTLVLVVLTVALGSIRLYRVWRAADLRIRAEQALEEAGALLDELSAGSLDPRTLAEARKYRSAAVDALRQDDAGRALAAAERSLVILRWLENPLPDTVQVLHSVGRPGFRLGGDGPFEDLGTRDQLPLGGWIQTDKESSVQLIFPEGTSVTVRPGALVVLNVVTAVNKGEVEISTSHDPREVQALGARLRMASESRAVVSVSSEGRSRFQVDHGRAELESGTETLQLRALQRVELESGVFSGVAAIPSRPDLLEPEEDRRFDLADTSELLLAWSPVPGAETYSLEVASDPLFAAKLIEARREKTSARFAVQEAGSFYWRVAARGAGDLQGPWSVTRTFHVISLDTVHP